MKNMNTEICSKIGDYLIGCELEDEGLLHGSAGMSIFFYNLAKETSDMKYKKHADSLIDKVFGKKTQLTDFKSGLAGIGWCIEYLIQNGFCSGNADEILEDADNRIFFLLSGQNEIPFNLYDGYIGYLQFIMMRLKNEKSSKLVKMVNIEMFKYLVNTIDLISPYSILNMLKDIKFDLMSNNYVLIKSLLDAMSLNLYNDKIINMFSQWRSFLTSSIPALHFNRVYMSILLFKMNRFLHLEAIDRHIRTLLFSIEKNTLMTEIDLRELYNVRFGFLGSLLILREGIELLDSSYPNYELLLMINTEISVFCDKRLIETINGLNNNKVQKKEVTFGLAEGWAGTGMLLLKTMQI